MVIWNSMRGVFGSCVRLETPPKMWRVMELTGRPSERAVKEWPSSWSNTVTKSRTVEIAPTRYAVPEPQVWNVLL